MTSSAVRVGTRGSTLAMAQTKMVAASVAKASGRDVELVPITAHGDHSAASLSSLSDTGVFTSGLREALVAGECDLLVHSLKDLPTAAYPGITVGAIPKREDARDVLCARDGFTVMSLPEGSRVGTGSPRHAAQLKAVRAELEAGDSTPIPAGASALRDGEMLFLSATIYANDGQRSLTSSHVLVVEGSAAERAQLPTELGIRVGRGLLSAGASELTTLGEPL